MRKNSIKTPPTGSRKLTPSSGMRRSVSRSDSKEFQLDDDQTPIASMVQSITSVEWLRRPSSVNEKVFQMQRQVSKSQDNAQDAAKSAELAPEESTVDEEEDLTLFDDDESTREALGEEPPEPEKKPKKKLGLMEYDLEDMYPEINILVRNKKRDWDFSDPEVIRALWLETKTGALADWRVKAAKIDFRKNPKIEVRSTVAENLKKEYLTKKAYKAKKLDETDFYLVNAGKEEPVFGPINIVSNLTTDMRFKYTRNNPPVPGRFIEHFSRYGKPPFTLNAAPCKNS